MIKYAVLGLLEEQPTYGYQLKRRFDERMGGLWRLNTGQVYQTLGGLVRAGLVREVAVVHAAPTDGPQRPRRVFELTPKGGQALRKWLERPQARARPMRDETMIRLMVLAPERHAAAAKLIKSLILVYRKQLARLLAEKRRLPVSSDRVTVVREIGFEAALLHTEAHLKWLEHTQSRLRSTEASGDEQGSVHAEPVMDSGPSRPHAARAG